MQYFSIFVNRERKDSVPSEEKEKRAEITINMIFPYYDHNLNEKVFIDSLISEIDFLLLRLVFLMGLFTKLNG